MDKFSNINCKNTSLIKHGIWLSALTFCSRIMGLVRETIKAAYLGTTPLADAFSIAFMIPNLLRRLFAENSMSVAFIPVFREYIEEGDDKKINELLSSVFTVLTFLVTLTVVAGVFISPFLIPFFGTLTDETVLLTRIMFPYLIFISLAAFLQGILNGIKIFSPSGFTPVLFNVCVILGTVILSRFAENSARAMALGVIIGGSIQMLFQLPFVLKNKFRFHFISLKKAFAHPGTKMILKLIGPTIIGMAAYQLNDVVSSALAGNAGPGVVSSLQYSLRIQELVLGIFAVSVGTVILPDLTGFAARKEWDGFNIILMRSMNLIALVTIPVTFFFLVCGENIISLLFKSNVFTDESVRLTLNAFSWHIAGLFFIALNRIIAPAFYAQKDTRSPTTAGIISFGINIFLAVILVQPLKGSGIALALSLASASNTIALFCFMRKKKTANIPMVINATVRYALKMLVFSFIASVPVYLLRPYVCSLCASGSRIVSQGLPVCICLCVFFFVGILLLIVSKDSYAAGLFASVKRRLKPR